MKLLLTILSAGLFFTACQQKEQKMVNGETKISDISSTDTTKWTEVQWVNENFDFGKVAEGPQVEVMYKVKNIGKNPLVIESVEKTCGCTETFKPEKPIMPGEEGIIKARYDSKGRVGPANKHINVVYNGKESPKSLSFTGEVLAKK
ncbi:MAG: DUF1573 domain-containing protein [Dinghuibacter sp.]|nr:DUF1573 domain-containing protein [Dinghuibacter sp.]